MSTNLPQLDGHERPRNLAVALRGTFTVLNDLVIPHLIRQGFTDLRTAHAAVFQYLDDTGTTVSSLAHRAHMTKQAMAELVMHLEKHKYVVRIPDPADGRAKLVLPTDRGLRVVRAAQALVPEIERRVANTIGEHRLRQLRVDLDAIQAEFGSEAWKPHEIVVTERLSGAAGRDFNMRSQGEAVRHPMSS